jgi:probable F420-dependent oxidoreductase
VPLKFGVTLPQSPPYVTATDVTAFAREAERIGYQSLWAYERLLTPVDQTGTHGLYGMPGVAWPANYRSVADPLITLAQAAAVTSRVELGTGVLVPPMHNPVRLAKSVGSLDVATGGRLIAGLGVGWSVDEFAATAPRPISERGAALDEFLDTAAALWGADPVTISGPGYELASSYFNPKPVRDVPIYLGGGAPAALERIARRRLGWLSTGVPPAQVVQTLSQLRNSAGVEVPAIVQVNYQSLAEVPADNRASYTGSPAQLTDDLAVLEAGGVGHIYVTLPSTANSLNELVDNAERVFAAVRDAGLVPTDSLV